MTLVEPPFVLDFASAQLDQPQDFPPEIMEHWLNSRRKLFGKDWPAAASVLYGLERHGVYMLDVHRGNIKTRNQPPDEGDDDSSSSSSP